MTLNAWPTHWSVCEVIVTLAFLACLVFARSALRHSQALRVARRRVRPATVWFETGGLIAGTLILAALTLTAADVLGLCRR